MPLTPGSRLGTYEFVSPLCANGMGDVFRARDDPRWRPFLAKMGFPD
jgi:hypothetical protein